MREKCRLHGLIHADPCLQPMLGPHCRYRHDLQHVRKQAERKYVETKGRCQTGLSQAKCFFALRTAAAADGDRLPTAIGGGCSGGRRRPVADGGGGDGAASLE